MSTAYTDLVNVGGFGEKRPVFNTERGDLAYWCHDCKKSVNVNRPNPEKATVECTVCKGKNIAICSEATLQEVYAKKRF